MDARRKTKPLRRWTYLGVPLLLVALAGGYWIGRDDGLRVEEERLTVKTVASDQFYEYINLTGRVEPEATYYVDSKVAGNVEEIFVEAGQKVRRGDTLLFVSNADLELEVMQREGELIEQLNSQQQTRLLLDQNDFTRREQLVEVDFQLDLEARRFARGNVLLADSLISRSDYEPTENLYAYYTQRRKLLRAAYRADSLARAAQLARFGGTEARLRDNLRRVRAILDRRYVLAATAGQLGDFTVRAGQAIATGERLGEIYRLDRPVLVAEADEFYLDRVFAGQAGQLVESGDTINLVVTKVYPTVTGGRFRIEVGLAEQEGTSTSLSGTGAAAAGAQEGTKGRWTRGRSFRLRLFFGQPRPSVLLASGNFYASTGGHWVYRLGTDGRARRTPVRLGRANPDYYEVLEGLAPGDRVITSAYEGFADYETLIINRP